MNLVIQWLFQTIAWTYLFARCYYRLRQLQRFRRSLDSDSLAILVYAVVNSRIDYCNTVLAGAPRTVTDKLQRVLNAAARVVTGTRKFHCCLGQTTNFTGLTSPTGCSSSWQWQFIGVWTAAHHRTCRTTASRSPLLTLGGICVPPTVNYLQCLVTGSTLTAVGPFQLPAPQSGTLSRILSGTRPSVQTVSDVCLKCICSLDTSAFSALEVLTITALYKFTYLLTYLLTALAYLLAR